MIEIILPELGEGIGEATVSYWHFEEGDEINQGDDLVEMATEKATFNVPASASGILSKKVVEEGQTVKVGQVLAIIESK